MKLSSEATENGTKQKPRKSSSKAEVSLPSLQAFIANVHFDTAFQDDGEVFKIAFDKNVARNLFFSENGAESDFSGTVKVISANRAALASLVLLTESSVVAPSDAEGKAGQVAYTTTFFAIQAGSTVQFSEVAIYNIVFDEQKGKRLITNVQGVLAPVIPDAVPSAAQLSLKSFVSAAFFGTLIQDDDEIFSIIYKRDYSPKVTEDDNGQIFNFKSTFEFIANIRKEISNRRLLSQSFTVNVADNLGHTGQVAHTAHCSGIQDGQEIQFTIVSIVEVTWLVDATAEFGGRRQTIMKYVVYAKDV